MRALKIVAVAVLSLVLGFATYQQETASRYHLDTLRKECYRTTRIFGLPIARWQSSVHDEYGNTYSAITGAEPRPEHWLQMRPDSVRSLWGGKDICFGLGYELRERCDLLERVYGRFPAKLSQAQAAAYIRRIDELVPADFRNRPEPDVEQIHRLRKELGLRSFYDSK
jgi:hypothetical protein